jgi:oxygen-independent coproporphyrinogen-3 oxidase
MDIRNAYGLLPDAEITLEANPDDLSAERLADWQALGINRLSLGVQAFQAEQLSWMHRAHSAEQALAAVPLLRAAGFAQYTVDLIYAAPGLTDTHWQENLARLADWQVPHISAYALTVEPRTALAKWVSTGKIAAPHDEAFARQFELLQQWAAQNGYQHYEVSNLALPGYRARHNSNYWHSRPYVGLGPGAHGFDGHRTRYHNLPDVWAYAQAGEAGQLPPTELESLSPIDRFNECLMTGLRLLEGASLGDLQAWCPPDRWPGWLAELQTYLTQERLQLAPGGFLRLPENLRTHADGIAADLFLLEEAVAGA